MEAKNQFTRPGSQTMADVITRIREEAGTPSTEREKIIKDVETACRWFGLKPDEVVAHAMNIRPRFQRLSPGALGVTNKRIQNVRSSVKAALRRADVVDGRSFKVPITEDWRTRVTSIADQYVRKKVGCIATFASAHGVAPDEIDDEFSTRLLQALHADRLHAEPRWVHQNAVRAWNRLVDTHPGWPKTKLTAPSYSKHKSPAVAPHPDLVAAIERFLVRHSTDDPFDLALPMVAWKSSTVATYRRYLRRYFGLLVTTGHRPEDLRTLRDLVLPVDRVNDALKLMMKQNDGTSRIGASHIARLLSQIAKAAAETEGGLSGHDGASLPDTAKALGELADRLHRRNKVLSQKNRERIAPLRDERNLAELFLLPFALAKKASSAQQPSRGEALQMQWALALLILTFCPLRISTLCELRIDQHLKWSRPGMKGELRLNFAWRELKTDAPEVIPLPPECARLIKIYIERFRDVVARPGSTFLFPGEFVDKGKGRIVMSQQLTTLVYKHTGFHVNPHLYRHLVHLVVLTRFPGAYAMISRVLTHRSLETARKNYAYFDVELSTRAYQDLVRDVQQGRTARASNSEIAYGIDREAMYDAKG